MQCNIQSPPLSDSPGRRRHFLRQSEYTKGYLSIEEYIYRCDPYLSTTIQEPWLLPNDAQPAPPDLTQRLEACKPEILTILSEQNFPDVHGGFFFRVQAITKPECPLGHQPITLLQLAYLFAESVPEKLDPTRDAVYDLIRQRGIRDVHVEIVFVDKCFQPSLFGIHKDDPAVGAYEIVKQPVLQTVNSKLVTQWNLLGLFKVGLARATATPSITVLVNPHTHADWSALSSQVKLLLPAAYRSGQGEINVEFLPGTIAISPTTTDDGLLMLSVREDGVPKPGTSIGVRQRGGGSLGPFVTLRRQDNVWMGALTSCPVVQPPSCADQADRSGASLDAVDSTNANVSYFAKKDKEKTACYLERQIQVETEVLQEVREEKEMREVAGMRVNQGLLFDIDQAQRTIASSAKKLATVRDMPLNLGKVLVSSGRALLDRIADWAIIGLNPEPFQGESSNFVNRMPHVPCLQKDYRQPFGSVYFAGKGRPLEEFGDLEGGEWYCKAGRTTDVTAGICNGISTYCNWPDSGNRVRFHKDGQQVPVEDGITEEWLIMSERRRMDSKIQTEFAQAGDAGSGIVDSRGRVCGLLYGTVEMLCGRNEQVSGLCSTMSDIRRWIEQKTGAVLGLPEDEEPV